MRNNDASWQYGFLLCVGSCVGPVLVVSVLCVDRVVILVCVSGCCWLSLALVRQRERARWCSAQLSLASLSRLSSAQLLSASMRSALLGQQPE